MGLAILILIFLGFSSFPLILYLWDGKKEKNIKKGVYYIIGFFVFIIVGIIALNHLGIWLAMATPFIFLIIMLIKWLISKNE